MFLPGKSHGRRSLAGYSPWGCRVGHEWGLHFHFHTVSAKWRILLQPSPNFYLISVKKYDSLILKNMTESCQNWEFIFSQPFFFFFFLVSSLSDNVMHIGHATKNKTSSWLQWICRLGIEEETKDIITRKRENCGKIYITQIAVGAPRKEKLVLPLDLGIPTCRKK